MYYMYSTHFHAILTGAMMISAVNAVRSALRAGPEVCYIWAGSTNTHHYTCDNEYTISCSECLVGAELIIFFLLNQLKLNDDDVPPLDGNSCAVPFSRDLGSEQWSYTRISICGKCGNV